MKSKVSVYFLFCAFIAIYQIAISYYLQTHLYRDGDITIHVNAAWRILHGEKLYRDIINIGFPMQFYLRVPQVWLAEKLGINILYTALVFDNFFSCITFILTLMVLSKMPFAKSRDLMCLLALVLIYVLFIFSVFTRCMGEKEYYFWVFTVPYFAMAAARMEMLFSVRFRFLVGVFAAIGFAYKPVTVIPLLLVEGYLCLQNRSFRSLLKVEFIICVLLNIVYLLWMFFYLPGYVGTMLPLAKFYLERRLEFSNLFSRFLFSLWFQCVLLACLALYLQRAKPSFYRFMNVWCIATLGYMLACVAQMKSFTHHYYATNAMVLTLFVMAFILFSVPHNPRSPNYLRVGLQKSDRASRLAGIGLILLMEYSCYLGVTTSTYGEGVLDYALNNFKKVENRPAQSVYELSMHIGPMFPEGMYRGLPWDYHFNHLWLMDGIRKFKARHATMSSRWKAEQTGAAEMFLQKTITQDIARLRPDIIISERVNKGSNPIRYFMKNPVFAELFRDYIFQAELVQSKKSTFIIYFRSPSSLSRLNN